MTDPPVATLNDVRQAEGFPLAPSPATLEVVTSGGEAGLRRGYKTTEFWIMVVTDVGILAAALAGSLAPRYAAIAATISTTAFTLARGLAKIGAARVTTLPGPLPLIETEPRRPTAPPPKRPDAKRP